MAIIRCPECGHEISDKAPVCPSCGVEIAGKITTCPKCGKVYFSDLAECPQCHNKTQIEYNNDISEPLKKEVQQLVDEKLQAIPNNDCKMDNNGNENEPNKLENGNKHSNNKLIVSIVTIVALIVIGICYYFYHSAQEDREAQAYEFAMHSNDPQVLQNYLENYLDAPESHIDSIQAHFDLLKKVSQDWTNALMSGSRSALEQYIAQYPNSPFKSIAIHKLDSIDWQTANQQNSIEAIEMYLEQHPNGEYVDAANNAIKTLNSKNVQPEEKLMISGTFSTFFQSLNNKDEDALTSTVSPVLTKFLGKSDATRIDVVTFMNRIYKSDVASIRWQSLGDYTINKKDIGNQNYEYAVSFSAVQSVTHVDNTTNEMKYKITATINNDGRISELNMIKILE